MFANHWEELALLHNPATQDKAFSTQNQIVVVDSLGNVIGF